MRRWLIRIVLLLVIGAVINVAVAWGLAVRPDARQNRADNLRWTNVARIEQLPPPIGLIEEFKCSREIVSVTGEIRVSESTFPRTSFGQTAMSNHEFMAELPSWSQLHERHPIDDFEAVSRFTESATGWPTVSLVRRRWLIVPSQNPLDRHLRESGSITLSEGLMQAVMPTLGNSSRNASRDRLPLIPIWPGFYVNTLLYACAAWVVFFAPFAALRFTKRARRRRNGLCLRCGYDLRGGTSGGACPECGDAVRAATAKERGTS